LTEKITPLHLPFARSRFNVTFQFLKLDLNSVVSETILWSSAARVQRPSRGRRFGLSLREINKRRVVSLIKSGFKVTQRVGSHFVGITRAKRGRERARASYDVARESLNDARAAACKRAAVIIRLVWVRFKLHYRCCPALPSQPFAPFCKKMRRFRSRVAARARLSSAKWDLLRRGIDASH